MKNVRRLINTKPNKKPVQNFFKVLRSKFRPMSVNDFLSDFRNTYVTTIVKTDPIKLEKKLFGKNDSIVSKDIFKSAVTTAQKTTTLPIMRNLELRFI